MDKGRGYDQDKGAWTAVGTHPQVWGREGCTLHHLVLAWRAVPWGRVWHKVAVSRVGRAVEVVAVVGDRRKGIRPLGWGRAADRVGGTLAHSGLWEGRNHGPVAVDACRPVCSRQTWHTIFELEWADHSYPANVNYYFI